MALGFSGEGMEIVPEFIHISLWGFVKDTIFNERGGHGSMLKGCWMVDGDEWEWRTIFRGEGGDTAFYYSGGRLKTLNFLGKTIRLTLIHSVLSGIAIYFSLFTAHVRCVTAWRNLWEIYYGKVWRRQNSSLDELGNYWQTNTWEGWS